MGQAQRFSVANVTLNYRLDGHGPRPLVCIHGVGSSLEAWAETVAGLQEQFTVLTFDLRGHGQSSRTPGRYEIDHLVGEALALADHVGFKQFDLAGFSLGGLIAQRMALTHPSRVHRLVLLSTVAGRNAEERERVHARLAALQAGEPVAHYEASLSRWLTEDFQARNPEVVTRLRQLNADNDPGCYAAAYRILAESDFGEQLSRIRCPTLIATGAEDAGSNPRMAAFMHDRIEGSQLRILPGLRHCILIEAPQQVAALIRDFLIDSETLMDKSLQAQGESVRRQVLGDSYVDQALGRADDFSRPFQAVLNEYCWGMVWTDDSLDLKQRSLLNLGMLAALGRMDEFGTHFCGALRNGLSDDELRAALVQIAVYCGVPAGVEAFRVARKARESMAPSDSTTG